MTIIRKIHPEHTGALEEILRDFDKSMNVVGQGTDCLQFEIEGTPEELWDIAFQLGVAIFTQNEEVADVYEEEEEDEL